jgi:putative sigma-54 modulation protein
MYSSIDQVMSKIEAQAKRLKERIKSKKRQEGKEGAVPEEEGFPDPPRVIVAETFAAKPLTVDDAVRELQGLNGLFLVFHNTQSGQVNVVYKRSDGHFGLVQPHS